MSHLIKQVNPWEMATNIWENVPLNQIKFLAEVLSELTLIADGKAAVVKITLDQFAKFNVGPDNADSFVNYARSIQGVELAVRFRETGKDYWKISLRSRGNIDASIISKRFGGGGHKNAAGFDFYGSFENGVKLIESIIKEAFPGK